MSDNIDAIRSSNQLLDSTNTNIGKSNNELDNVIQFAKTTLKEYDNNKINLERTLEIKNYYSLKYKAINNVIKVIAACTFLLYLFITFIGIDTIIKQVIVFVFILIMGVYLQYMYHDIEVRDKRNFEEYTFVKPNYIDHKQTPAPKKKRICIRTDCTEQGDTHNNNKKQMTHTTQKKMMS
jgi:hypothetical protein